jgi:hypothetical protein
MIRRCTVPKLRRSSKNDSIACSADRRKSRSKPMGGVDKPGGFFNPTWRNSRVSRTRVLKNLRGISTNALEMARSSSELRLGAHRAPSRILTNSAIKTAASGFSALDSFALNPLHCWASPIFIPGGFGHGADVSAVGLEAQWLSLLFAIAKAFRRPFVGFASWLNVAASKKRCAAASITKSQAKFAAGRASGLNAGPAAIS